MYLDFVDEEPENAPSVAMLSQDWENFAPYILTQIEAIHGRQIPNPKSEAIALEFLKRWGEWAWDIAKWSFQVEGGFWRKAPITISRFSESNDEFFAQPITELISASEAKDS